MPAQFKPARFTSTPFRKPEPKTEPAKAGDIEIDSAAEMTAIKTGFVQRALNEDKRRQKATDSEYWVCLCFQSREQVEAFIETTGWGRRTDKYIDGQRVAAKLGVKLPHEDPPSRRIRISDDWSNLSLPIR